MPATKGEKIARRNGIIHRLLLKNNKFGNFVRDAYRLAASANDLGVPNDILQQLLRALRSKNSENTGRTTGYAASLQGVTFKNLNQIDFDRLEVEFDQDEMVTQWFTLDRMIQKLAALPLNSTIKEHELPEGMRPAVNQINMRGLLDQLEQGGMLKRDGLDLGRRIYKLVSHIYSPPLTVGELDLKLEAQPYCMEILKHQDPKLRESWTLHLTKEDAEQLFKDFHPSSGGNPAFKELAKREQQAISPTRTTSGKSGWNAGLLMTACPLLRLALGEAASSMYEVVYDLSLEGSRFQYLVGQLDDDAIMDFKKDLPRLQREFAKKAKAYDQPDNPNAQPFMLALTYANLTSSK
ncbi:MAG: hypothetical protein ACSHYB_17495 [Roseibacillus sp.]